MEGGNKKAGRKLLPFLVVTTWYAFGLLLTQLLRITLYHYHQKMVILLNTYQNRFGKDDPE